jgi:hypothetical protein
MYVERLLPTPVELPKADQDFDTQLHWMAGPPIETAQWVIDSWKAAAEKRLADDAAKSDDNSTVKA